MSKISPMEFAVQDIYKRKYKITFKEDQFNQVYFIFGRKSLYSFTVFEKTFDSDEKKSFSLIETEPYDDKKFVLMS